MLKKLLISLMFCSIATATVSTTNSKITYTGNSATQFTFGFPILTTAAPHSDLEVRLRTVATGAEMVLTETTDYSVSATNNDFSSGGTVTTVSTYSSSYQIIIARIMPLTQQTDLDDSGTLRLESLEDSLDKLTFIVQDQNEIIARCLKFPKTDSTSLTSTLPSSVGRASGYISMDSSGNVNATSVLTTGTASISSFGENLISASGALAARIMLEAQKSDNELTALASVTSAANKLPYFTGSTTASVTDLSTAGRSLIDDDSVSAMRVTLGVGIETIAKTSAVINPTDSNFTGYQTYTNLGATTSTHYNLIAGATNYTIEFMVVADYAMQIDPNGTEAFIDESQTSSGGKYIYNSTPGSSIKLKWNGSAWQIINRNGIWEIEN